MYGVFMSLDRKLIRNGNGWALFINSTILNLLDVNPEQDMVKYTVENDKLIGFCEGVLNYEIIENQKPVLTIWNVRVLPEYRKRGVGRKLMELAEKFAKENNAIGIFLGADFENEMARGFYKKLGFKENYSYFKLIK